MIHHQSEIIQRSMLNPGRCSAVIAALAIIISVISQMATASSLIALSSPLSEGQQVCPGDAIVFTCVTNGSSILAWSGDDYIGQGVQLEFASFHDPGRIARNRASPIGTQAVLISKEIEENETLGILESQLSIVVTPDYQTATIKCLHVDTGSEETTGFQLLDGPGAPEEVKVFEIPDDRRSRGVCVLTLQLNHPSDVALDEIPHLSYFIYYYGQQREVITAATSKIFVVQNCTPDLLINVTVVNRCGNMGGSVIGIAPEFLSVTVPNPANAGLIAGVTISVIIAVITVIAVIILIIIIFIEFKQKRKKSLEHRELASVEMNAEHNLTVQSGYKALYKASKEDRLEVLKRLLQSFADENSESEEPAREPPSSANLFDVLKEVGIDILYIKEQIWKLEKIQTALSADEKKLSGNT